MSESAESPELFTEFRIIDVLRDRCAVHRDDVLLGIGDDAAVTRVPSDHELVTATDALVEGTHFLAGASPRSIGHRSLAVNLSDLAAMGAVPHWATLSLALPAADMDWVSEFADGFARLASIHDVSLIGGDTVRGPLSVSVTLLGVAPADQVVVRTGAQPGDDVYLSGNPGRAAAGCRLLTGELSAAKASVRGYKQRFEFPEPRVALGVALRTIATAMIDISDGVHHDLSRLLVASSVGAEVAVPDLDELQRDFGPVVARELFLNGGEDYELCFTASTAHRSAIAQLATEQGITIYRGGVVTAATGLRWRQNGVEVDCCDSGFEHFEN